MPANPYEMHDLKMLGLTDQIVERCFLMNLDRRGDRLKDWLQQLPEPWPLR